MSDPGDFLYEQLRLATRREVLRGSLVSYLRKCGKKTCACSKRPERRHPSLFLAIRSVGRQKNIHVRKTDETKVRALVENYVALKQAIETVSAYEAAKLVRQAGDRRRKQTANKSKR